jgi:hypothetical protein
MRDMAWIVFGLIALVVVVRLLAGGMDGDRIAGYLRSRGCVLRSKVWTPFGRGWFGDKKDRIYAIEYDDPDGNRRRATAKTSLFAGVYLTDDELVRSAQPSSDPPTTVAELRAENEALRAEVERLRRQGS